MGGGCENVLREQFYNIRVNSVTTTTIIIIKTRRALEDTIS